MKTKYTIIYILIFVWGCTSNSPTESKEAAIPTQDVIELSSEERALIKLQTTTLSQQTISSTIKASGMLDVPPNSKISLSAPIPAFVKHTSMLQGTHVHKGDVVVQLQHPDFIQLQQDYLEQKSQLAYLEAENTRQQQLAKDNINAQKTAQQAKAAFESAQARVKGLTAKLKLLGVNPSTLSSGELLQWFDVKSPIDGYITQVNVNIGSFVNPTEVMFTLVNTEHLHAELTIFEKDVSKVAVGQKVVFTLSNETKERTAQIHLIGREIKADRSVQIHCHLDKEDRNLLPGTFLKAEIETDARTVMSVPTEAIVGFEGANYIFIARDSATFECIKIEVGAHENGYTEIMPTNSITEKDNIVTTGAYALLGKLKNAAEEE
ncbi:MAG: efflux RND transporter periplasmic adaptor subunit [Bacteroidia bacterium]|jgi:cobalt-zinc-cadmium efflux system membrane fusion protein|nr:efflux RND transporter periplasmic adaptor subunit [Bacteroidia bacterium]